MQVLRSSVTGYKNVNQTPESNVLRDLSGMDVYQTSDKGTIVVSSDGKNLSVSAQKGGNVPSHAGYVVKQKRTPLMQKVTVQANTKKKMTPLRSDASAAYQHYERKKHQDEDFSTGKKLHKSKTDSVQICEKRNFQRKCTIQNRYDINAQRRHDRQGLCEVCHRCRDR